MEGITWLFFAAAVAAAIWRGSVEISVTRQENENQARRIEAETLKTCPFCAEKIRVQATVCRYCARDL